MLERLNQVNDVPVFSVRDPEFLSYGRLVTGYDFSNIISYMEQETRIPEEGNIYHPSIPEMEREKVCGEMQQGLYGGMEIQIGYCNGRNTTYNGFEYHKGSEINIAVTDFMLVLGHCWEIQDKSFDTGEAKVFFVEKGMAVEMYQTTLHLSPCRVNDQGFMDIVVLPRGTNTPLELPKNPREPETELLLMKNKWVLAHPQREPLIRQGAYPGVTGENRELYY